MSRSMTQTKPEVQRWVQTCLRVVGGDPTGAVRRALCETPARADELSQLDTLGCTTSKSNELT